MLLLFRLLSTLICLQLSLHYLFYVVFKDTSPLPTLIDLQNHLGISRTSQLRFDNYTKLAVDPEVHLDTAPPIYVEPTPPVVVEPNARANATFVLLCRNNDVNGAVASVQQMEDRFNRKHGYPWVLLNDEPFTDEFKKYVSLACVQSSYSQKAVVGCESSRMRLYILARYPGNIGTSLTGSTKTMPKQGGRRWWHKGSSTQVRKFRVSCLQEAHARRLPP